VDTDGKAVMIDEDDTSPTGYTFNYEWQYSPNGRTLWEVIRDADQDAVRANTGGDPESRQLDLDLPEIEKGGYVRLVVIYRDEGDATGGVGNQVEGRVNRIESEAVKVGEIMHVLGLHIDDSTDNAPSGIVPAGRTLHIDGLVDPRGGSSKVEWLVGGRTLVGEGREYTVSDSDRDSISARVTRYDKDGGLVSKTTTAAVTLTPNAAPVLAQPVGYEHFVDLGKAPDANGKYAMLEGMIDLQSLFTDPEGGPVGRFMVSVPATSRFHEDAAGSGDLINTGTLDLYFDNNGSPLDGPAVADGIRNALGDQLLLIDEADGRIEYHTTRAQNHDRDTIPDARDGMGNYISLTVTGSDSARNPVGSDTTDDTDDDTADVNLRIDAAPRGFEVSADATNTPGADPANPADNAANTDNRDDSNTVVDEVTGAAITPDIDPRSDYFGLYRPPEVEDEDYTHSVREHNSDNGEVVELGPTGQQTAASARVIARIDVQDDNMPTHAYGQYTFEVDDPRFEVVAVSPRFGGDASQGILRLKTGESLDYEAENADSNPNIELAVTATPADHPGGGDGHDPIRLSITVNVINVDEETDPNENDVPGLEDNESDDSDTNLDDAGTDTPAGSSTASGSEIVGDDTDTDDDTAGDADNDHDGGWWSASDDGLF